MASLEIERVYLLARLPSLPDHAAPWHIDQGYLPQGVDAAAEGRVRRIVGPDGAARYLHTIKRGLGLVREETERPLTQAEFEALWPRTVGRRLRKVRHKVAEGDLTWEVDAFLDLPLVLAEVELPEAEHQVALPPWLAPHVLREVTSDSRYRNYELARSLGRGLDLPGTMPGD